MLCTRATRVVITVGARKRNISRRVGPRIGKKNGPCVSICIRVRRAIVIVSQKRTVKRSRVQCTVARVSIYHAGRSNTSMYIIMCRVYRVGIPIRIMNLYIIIKRHSAAGDVTIGKLDAEYVYTVSAEVKNDFGRTETSLARIIICL